MRIACPSCSTVYNIDDAKIPATGANLKCAKCKASFPVKPGEGLAPPAPPAPPAPRQRMPSRPPQPTAAPSTMPSSPTAIGTVPLPPPDTLFDAIDIHAPAARSTPPSAPRAGGLNAGLDFGAPPDAAPAPAAAPDFGFDLGTAPMAETPSPFDLGTLGLSPNAPTAASAGAFDLGADAGSGFGTAPAGSAFGTAPSADPFAFPPQAPAPASDPLGFGEVDFGAPPPSPTVAPAGAPPLARPKLDFGEVDFGGSNDPTSGAAPLDFDDFPAPPTPGAGVGAPVPPPPPLDFGEVDLNAAPTAAPLDPFGTVPADAGTAGPALDYLGSGNASGPGASPFGTPPAGVPAAGADAPAPSRPPNMNTGDLELLDFVDDGSGQKTEAGAPSLRYQIRRKSGKTFGPFEVSAILAMLEQAQLLGNEDVSLDGQSWVPMATVSPFGELIQKQIAAANGDAAPAEGSGEITTETKAEALERMKALYGDRMAAIAIVDAASAHDRFRRKLPFIAVGVVLLAVLGVGLYLGTTPYGVFGLRRLFPRTLSEGSAAYVKFREATRAIEEDTWDAYRRALDDAQVLLNENDSVIESRALFAQVVFYMKRRYGAADEKMALARKYVEELVLSAKDRPEVIKARAGQALIDGDHAAIRAQLEAAAVAHPEDPEFEFLLAESYLTDRSAKPAAEALRRMPKLGMSGKGLHYLALAKLHEKPPDAKVALENFVHALEANPNHLTSAVEAAALELEKLEMPDKAREHLELALGENSKKLLAPVELARAHYLEGTRLASRQEFDAAQKHYEEALKIDSDSAAAKAAYGRFLLKRHDYERAYELFEAAHNRDPKEVDHLDGLVRAMIGASKLHTAAKTLADASAQHPGNPRIAFLQGRVSDEIDKGEDAERSYKRAIAGDDKFWEAQYYLGRFYLRRKRFDDAKAAFDKALEKAPGAPEPHVGLGQYLLAQGKLHEARARFEEALKIDAGHAGAHFGFAQVLIAEGQLDEARRELEQVIAVDPSTAQAYTTYGGLLWELRDLEGASKALEKAKVTDPKDPGAVWRLGAVYFEMEKYGEAMKNLDTAMALDPSNADAYFYKARVHHARNENTQAIEAMKTALERSPNRPDYHYWMGNVLYQAQRFDNAFEQWQEAVRLKRDYADALEALARGYQEQGKFAEAMAAFEKAYQADRTRARLMASVGDCFFAQNQYDKAIAKYQEALRADEKLVSVYAKIGRCYNEKGRLGEAIEWYQRATKRDPDASEVYRFLGYAYKERSRKPEAIAAFEKYLETNKDAGDAKDIRNEIYDLKNEK